MEQEPEHREVWATMCSFVSYFYLIAGQMSYMEEDVYLIFREEVAYWNKKTNLGGIGCRWYLRLYHSSWRLQSNTQNVDYKVGLENVWKVRVDS